MANDGKIICDRVKRIIIFEPKANTIWLWIPKPLITASICPKSGTNAGISSSKGTRKKEMHRWLSLNHVD
jgi:hypothetical protein